MKPDVIVRLLVTGMIPRRLKALGIIDAYEIEVRVNRQWRKTLNELFYTNQAFPDGISQKDMSASVVFKVFCQVVCELKGVKEVFVSLTDVTVGGTLNGCFGDCSQLTTSFSARCKGMAMGHETCVKWVV